MTTPASRVTAEKSEAAALSDERLWLVTAGPDGEVSQVAVGFDAMMDAVVRCIWEDPSGEEGADQMREEMVDADFWSGDFWSCQWAFEDGYLQVQRITDASALRSVPPDSVSATPTLSVEGIVREIEVLLDNCHVVEGIDIAAQHEAVMVLVRSLSDSVSDGSKGVRVKPLEWHRVTQGFSLQRAATTFGDYRIWVGDDGGWFWAFNDQKHSDGAEDSEDAAKASVNADYRQRILFSLDSGTGGQQPVANDAAARLWLSAADADNEHQLWFDPDEGGTPYVRADLASPVMDIEEIIDAVMESERYEPKVVPVGANPPLFDGMQPYDNGAWVSRVDVAKRLRAALTAALNGGKPTDGH